MKLLVIFFALVVFSSCNTSPKTPANNQLSDSLRFATDTTGLAEYQAWKAQNELGENTESSEAKPSATSKKTSSSSASSSSGNSAETGSGETQTGSGTTAKKGWSKTAKGAVIGGVVGAGTGAIVNKKNRAAGAVVGGVIGAGAGAIIGNEMDKKDGRH